MEAQTEAFSLLTLFQMGGTFMWPLLVFSVAAIAIALERTFYVLMHDLKVDPLTETLVPMVRARDLPSASAYLEALPKRVLARSILLELISRPRLSEHQIERAVETQAQAVIASLESGFNFLTAIGSIAPITGFLGTVSGMIGAFRSIAEATEVNAQIVANGIYEALITTVFGLIIAIIAMVAHSILTTLIDRFTLDVEQSCSVLITELEIQKQKGIIR
jgi:biopolymer transport protein ExbB